MAGFGCCLCFRAFPEDSRAAKIKDNGIKQTCLNTHQIGHQFDCLILTFQVIQIKKKKNPCLPFTLILWKKKWRDSESRSVVSDSLWPHGLWPTRRLWPWNSPGKNTGVGSHSLPQEIFLTQGSNQSLLHCREILYRLSHQGTPYLNNSLYKVQSVPFWNR